VPLIDHLDLVVSSLARSLPFYRGLLGPLGWVGVHEVRGERGETIHYLYNADRKGSLGLREKQSDANPTPYDRYGVGVHHVAFDAPSRKAVDKAAEWLRGQGAQIESGPEPYDYQPGYYALFFYDPDGIKLELVYLPRAFSPDFMRGLVRATGATLGRRFRRRTT
jgi:catechol 2,3-dioxygenase-like lactoylglutathione lyase family enzyme